MPLICYIGQRKSWESVFGAYVLSGGPLKKRLKN